MAEVASAFVSLVPSAKGFGGKISSEIGGDLDSAGKSSGKRFGGAMSTGIGGSVGKMFAPVAAGIAALGVGAFFKDAIAGASDLGESGSKVGIVFGKSAGQIMEASKTSAKAMGLSQNAYLGATGSLGNLLVSLDIAPKKAADMSQQMVKLAGDLASFNNVAPEEALAALQSGLTGETEPLKRFGVNMNDATLKAQALKMGLIDSVKEAMDPQTKALAAQALIMKQTGTAQGDFARTSGGLANQQRILAARSEELKTKVGGFLLPTMTKFVTFLNNDMGPILGKTTAFFQPVIGGAKALVAAFMAGGSDVTSSGFAGVMERIGLAARALGDFFMGTVVPGIRALVAAFQAGGSDVTSSGFAGVMEQIGLAARVVANFFTTQVVPAIMGIVTAVQAFVAVALPIVQSFVAGMIARFQPMLPTILTIFATIGSIITAAMGLIQAVISRVTTVIQFIWETWGGSIMSFISGVWAKILVVIQAALTIIQGIIKTVTSVIKGDWSGAWDGIKQIVSGAWDAIKGIISAALTIIGGLMSAGWALIKLGVSTGWEKIMDFIKSIPGRITSALGNLGSLLFNKGKEIIQGLIDGVGSMVSNLASAMGNAIKKGITDLLPGSPVKKGPLRVLNNGYAGGQIVKMLAAGVDSQRFSLAASLDSIVSGPSIQSAPRLEVASLLGSGGGMAQINASFEVDGQVFFKAMRTVSIDEARRNGKSGLAS